MDLHSVFRYEKITVYKEHSRVHEQSQIRDLIDESIIYSIYINIYIMLIIYI